MRYIGWKVLKPYGLQEHIPLLSRPKEVKRSIYLLFSKINTEMCIRDRIEYGGDHVICDTSGMEEEILGKYQLSENGYSLALCRICLLYTSQAPFYFDNSTLDIYLMYSTGATLNYHYIYIAKCFE